MFFLLTFGGHRVDNVRIGVGRQRPEELALRDRADAADHDASSAIFISTAFVANVVVRDDETGFGPIIRSTRVSQVRLPVRPLHRRVRRRLPGRS